MSRLSGLASRFLATAPQSTRHKLHALRFRRLTDDLWDLVELCDDATRKLGGQWVLDRRYVASFGQKALELGREIVFDSGVLAGGDSSELYANLDSVRGGLDGLLTRGALGDSWAPLVVPLGHAEGADAVWEPLRRLAELQQHLEMVIPEGFAITVAGLVEHLKHNGLWERVQRASDSGDEAEARSLAEALRAAPLPETIRSAIDDATATLVGIEPEASFALYATPTMSEPSGRSGEWAHAVHGLSPEDVGGAYARLVSDLVPRRVVREDEGWPCVTCVREAPTEWHGVLLTSDPDRPLNMRLEIGAGGETHVVPRHPPEGERDGLPEDLAPLARMAFVVERFAGRPQKIGWIRNEVGFVVMHCSDLDPPATEPPSGPRLAEALRRHESVYRDPASVAVAGFAVGPVRRVPGRRRPTDAARPSVLVLEDATGDLPRDLLRNAAAVLAVPDVVEEPWLALAREWCVPVLGGLGAATVRLEEGETVTVDADDGVVYRGLVEDLVLHHLVEPSSYQAEPEYRLLREAIRRVVPPSDAGAAPEPQGASHLGEVLRGAHERALGSFGALHLGSWGRREGKALRGAGFPGSVRVVDAGGGVSPPCEHDWRSGLAWPRIRSEPFRALLEPLTPADPEQSTLPRGPGPAALAVLTEERAVVHVQWPTGTLLIDAGLGGHASANTIYCALRGTPVGDAEPFREAVVEAGFHVLDLGPGLTGWRPARELEDTRRVLGRMGRALGTLLSESARTSRRGDDQ
jgi:pyruvate,water dikinase